MPIYAKAGANFTPAPAGSHAAVCIDVVDMGMVRSEFAGQVKMQHKVRIVWQIDEDRDDGKPFHVNKRYTLSLHEKSSLRADLQSWRGKPFTEKELAGFDLEDLLSAPALLNVIHVPKNGTTYANVTAIIRLPKNMTAPAVRDYVRVCDRQPEQSEPVLPEESYVTDEDVPF